MNDFYLPETLEIRIGGFSGPCYGLVKVDETLEYQSNGCSNGAVHVSIVPTTARWKAFRCKLDKFNVWYWRRRYVDDNILDGTQWEMKLCYPDRRILTSGSNDYPPDFNLLIRAVRALIGGLEFR